MFGLIASSKQSTLAWTQDLGCPEMWHALVASGGEKVHAKIVSWIEGRLAQRWQTRTLQQDAPVPVGRRHTYRVLWFVLSDSTANTPEPACGG